MRNPVLAFTAFLLLPDVMAVDAAKIGDRGAYHEVIVPIIESKCVSCHGEDKAKGKLRMDSFEAIMKGGASGEAVEPGDPDSELIYRIITVDEDDHMPPPKKPQLSSEEIEVIKWWVVNGAEETKKVGELAPDPALLAKIQAVVAASSATALVAGGPGAPSNDQAAKAAEVTVKAEAVSQELGVPILAIANGSDELQFDAVNVTKTFGDAELGKLAPLGGSLVDVNLARTQVTDVGLVTLGKMGAIKKLRLENTKVGDEGLKHLAKLAELEYLNLYGTDVTDAGINSLSSLKALKKLFVWETEVTREAAEKLVEQVPGLTVNLGWGNEVPGPPPAPKTSEENPETKKAS